MVTGASRGLGRAIALALAGAGATVALAARSKRDLEETARLVKAAGARAIVATTDVASYPAVETLMKTVVASFGRVDIVVNNPGIARPKPLAETSPEEWQGVVDANLTGVFNGCRAAAQYLIGQGSGKVINLASVGLQLRRDRGSRDPSSARRRSSPASTPIGWPWIRATSPIASRRGRKSSCRCISTVEPPT